jgi:hypothetical protein
MCFMTGACVLLVLAFGAFLVPGIMSWQFAFSNAHEAAELETHDNERSRLEDRGDQLSLGGHKVMLGVTLAALGFLIRYAL